MSDVDHRPLARATNEIEGLRARLAQSSRLSTQLADRVERILAAATDGDVEAQKLAAECLTTDLAALRSAMRRLQATLTIKSVGGAKRRRGRSTVTARTPASPQNA